MGSDGLPPRPLKVLPSGSFLKFPSSLSEGELRHMRSHTCRRSATPLRAAGMEAGERGGGEGTPPYPDPADVPVSAGSPGGTTSAALRPPPVPSPRISPFPGGSGPRAGRRTGVRRLQLPLRRRVAETSSGGSAVQRRGGIRLRGARRPGDRGGRGSGSAGTMQGWPRPAPPAPPRRR